MYYLPLLYKISRALIFIVRDKAGIIFLSGLYTKVGLLKSLLQSGRSTCNITKDK